MPKVDKVGGRVQKLLIFAESFTDGPLQFSFNRRHFPELLYVRLGHTGSCISLIHWWHYSTSVTSASSLCVCNPGFSDARHRPQNFSGLSFWPGARVNRQPMWFEHRRHCNIVHAYLQHFQQRLTVRWNWSHTRPLPLESNGRWLVALHSSRTPVRRSFPAPRSTCSWRVTTYVGKPSAIGQPTRPTQPFIISGLINGSSELLYWMCAGCSDEENTLDNVFKILFKILPLKCI